MKQGTVSYLFGCHSIVHSFYVWKAWRHLYKKSPAAWETVCILIHDSGHIGKQYLDDYEQKKLHWELGARIAKRLFGQRGYDLTAGHCEYSGLERSRLYFADKYAWKYEPYWWAWWNAVVEPKLKMGYTLREAYTRFHAAVEKSIESGEFRSTHQLYLERCKEREL